MLHACFETELQRIVQAVCCAWCSVDRACLLCCALGMHCSAGGDEDPPREPLELWVANMATGKARRLMEHRLNSTFEE